MSIITGIILVNLLCISLNLIMPYSLYTKLKVNDILFVISVIMLGVAVVNFLIATGTIQ